MHTGQHTHVHPTAQTTLPHSPFITIPQTGHKDPCSPLELEEGGLCARGRSEPFKCTVSPEDFPHVFAVCFADNETESWRDRATKHPAHSVGPRSGMGLLCSRALPWPHAHFFAEERLSKELNLLMIS